MTGKISKYISYGEAVKSATATKHGIRNIPNIDTIERMRYVAKNVFDPMREHFGIPIAVTSFFRSPELNLKCSGAKKSQHMLGEAIDIDADVFGGVTNREIYEYIRDNCEYDQLIWELGDSENPGWVHVSLTARRPNRKQLLRALRSNGKITYWLWK